MANDSLLRLGPRIANMLLLSKRSNSMRKYSLLLCRELLVIRGLIISDARCATVLGVLQMMLLGELLVVVEVTFGEGCIPGRCRKSSDWVQTRVSIQTSQLMRRGVMTDLDHGPAVLRFEGLVARRCYGQTGVGSENTAWVAQRNLDNDTFQGGGESDWIVARCGGPTLPRLDRADPQTPEQLGP